MKKQYKNETISTGVVKKTDADGNVISYRFTVAMGMTLDGKQIRKTKTYKPLREWSNRKADKEAIREYGRFYDYCKANNGINGNMRFYQLFDRYKEANKSKIRTSTMTNKCYTIDRHVLPVIGNMRITDINTIVISDLLASIQKEGNYKRNSLRSMKTDISSIFNYALSQGLIEKNPCTYADLPNVAEKRTENKFLDISEINDFLELFQENELIDRFVQILLHTGLREGELLGLKWDCIDWENKAIAINNTLTYVPKKGFSLADPKTKGSNRIIYADDTVLKLLREQRLYENKKKLTIGMEFKHPEMIFTTSEGNYWHSENLRYHFRKRVKSTKFEKVTFHWLRHTNASILFSSGHSSKEVSHHLGHSNTIVTENIYIDLMENNKKQIVADIEKALAK